MASINSQLQALGGMNSALSQTNSNLTTAISNFNRLQQASAAALNPAGIRPTYAAFQQINNVLVLIKQEMKETREETEKESKEIENKFLTSLNKCGAAAKVVYSKIGDAVKQFATLENIQKVANISDSLVNSENRLSLLVDDGGSVDALQSKLFNSAESARTSYTDLMQTVSNLGFAAGDTFASNDEMVAFAELINKGFAVSGTAPGNQSGIMEQITQAMAGGGLGESDLLSLASGAPAIASAIQSYMQGAGVEGTLQDWASSGMLTADVIKNALFSASDSINTRFSQLPMTWSQIGTSIQNQALVAFEPVLQKINALANSESIQIFMNILTNTFFTLATVASNVLDMVAGIAEFISENWSDILPVITAIVAALTLFTIILGIAKIAEGAAVLIAYAHATAKRNEVSAQMAAIAAQNGYNTALLSCPLVWILLIIIAVIAAFYAVIAVINQVTGASISATGIIFGAITTAVAAIWNIFLGLAELVLGIISYLINPFIEFGNFLANVFTNPVSSIIYLFQGLADNVLGFIESIASALDFVFGSNMADTVASWRRELKAYADDAVKKYAPNENYERKFDSLDLSIDGISEALGIDLNRWDYSDAWNTGYNAGEGLESSIGDMFGGFSGGDLFDSSLLDPSAYTAGSASGLSGGGAGPGTYDTGSLGAISGDTAAIRENTARSEEDLSLLREIAEREAINRFTTAEVKVDMTGMNNTIHSDMDIDGFITVFTDRFAEALTATAEGVHV